MPGQLVATIEGLPGCGKSFLCGKIHDLGYATADVDDFSQAYLRRGYHDCDDFQTGMIARVRTDITKWVNSLADGTKVVLCGVSGFLFEDECLGSVVDCSAGCQKIWLDIAPRTMKNYNRHKIAGMSKVSNMELLESTRRAVLREFTASELSKWKSMTSRQRKEEGGFWKLRPPSHALTDLEFMKLFHMDLNTFIDTHETYFSAMLDVQLGDNVHLSRDSAIKTRRFKPMTFEKILATLASPN